MTLLLRSTLFLTALAFAYLGWHCYFGDSEIWAIALAKQIPHINTANISLLYKIPFYSFFKISYLFANENTEVFLSARVLGTLLGLFLVYLTYRLAKYAFGCKKKALWAALFLLTTTIFFNRGFRVRSDFLASIFHLLFLLQFYLCYFQKKLSVKRLWTFSLLTLAMLATTPKAILLVLALFALSFFFFQIDREKRNSFVRYAFVYPTTFLITLILVSPWPHFPDFFSAYQSAFDYFQNTYLAEQKGVPTYLSKNSFFYFRGTMLRNPVFSAFIYLSFFLSIFSLIKKKRVRKYNFTQLLQLHAFLILLIIVFHNDKLPFFIAAQLPLLSIVAVRGWLFLHKRLGRFKTVVSSLLVLLLLLKTTNFLLLNLDENNNKDQLNAIALVSKSLDEKSIYYDSLGTLPLNQTIYAFVGPSQKKSIESIKERIQQSPPDFLMITGKSTAYKNWMLQPLKDLDMVSLGGGIFAKGVRPRSTYQVDGLSPKKLMKAIPTEVVIAYLKSYTPKSFSEEKTVFMHYSSMTGLYQYSDLYSVYAETKDGQFEKARSRYKIEDLETKYKAFWLSQYHTGLLFSQYEPIKWPFRSNYHQLFAFDVRY